MQTIEKSLAAKPTQAKEIQQTLVKFEKFATHVMKLRNNGRFGIACYYKELFISDLRKFRDVNKDHKDVNKLDKMIQSLHSSETGLIISKLVEDSVLPGRITETVLPVFEFIVSHQLCRDAIDECVCDKF